MSFDRSRSLLQYGVTLDDLDVFVYVRDNSEASDGLCSALSDPKTFSVFASQSGVWR